MFDFSSGSGGGVLPRLDSFQRRAQAEAADSTRLDLEQQRGGVRVQREEGVRGSGGSRMYGG